MMGVKEDNQGLSAKNWTSTTADDQQREVYDAVLESDILKHGQIFALDASGGTGKTHPINLTLAAVWSCQKIALATA